MGKRRRIVAGEAEADDATPAVGDFHEAEADLERREDLVSSG